MDALRYHDLFARMPPCSIQHQQDLLGGTSSDSLSKVGKRDGEHLRCHRGQQQPFGLARSRLQKAVDVEPLVALMHADARARPFAHPNASEDGFESHPMLISRPQLNRRLGKGLLERVQVLWEVFLNASWAAGSALAWRGRNTRLL